MYGLDSLEFGYSRTGIRTLRQDFAIRAQQMCGPPPDLLRLGGLCVTRAAKEASRRDTGQRRNQSYVRATVSLLPTPSVLLSFATLSALTSTLASHMPTASIFNNEVIIRAVHSSTNSSWFATGTTSCGHEEPTRWMVPECAKNLAQETLSIPEKARIVPAKKPTETHVSKNRQQIYLRFLQGRWRHPRR